MSDPTPNLKLRNEIFLKAWTQKDLAEKTGISEAYISRFINGYMVPTADQRKAIAAALRVAEGKVF